MSIQMAILTIAYMFIVIPLVGRLFAIGASPKSYWIGYEYNSCLERGVIIHFAVLAIGLVVWAITTI